MRLYSKVFERVHSCLKTLENIFLLSLERAVRVMWGSFLLEKEVEERVDWDFMVDFTANA